MRDQGQPPTSIKGYTLLELMIVLAILVSIMAMAWPSIARRMKLIGPREAALQVKADLAEARERAITSGQAWAFRIDRGGPNYEFGPVREFREELLKLAGPADILGRGLPDSFTTSESKGSSTGTPAWDDSNPPASVKPREVRENELPPGIVFDDGFAHSVSEANTIKVPLNPQVTSTQVESLTIQPQADAQWKFAVIFQPNGRATESEIRLKELTTENTIRLRIRRFTGGVSIDKVERKPANVLPAGEGEPFQQEDVPPNQGEPPYTPAPSNSPPASNELAPPVGER